MGCLNTNERTKAHATIVVPGMQLVDSRCAEPVCSTKNKCIVVFFPNEGKTMQILIEMKQYMQYFENHDGTKPRLPNGRVNTVYCRTNEFAIAI